MFNGMSFNQQPQSMFGENPFNMGVDIQSLQKPGNLLSSKSFGADPFGVRASLSQPSEDKPSGLQKAGGILKALGDAFMYMTAAMPGPSQQGAASLLAMSNAQKEKDEDRKTALKKLFLEFLSPKSEWGKMAADFKISPERVAELRKSGGHAPAQNFMPMTPEEQRLYDLKIKRMIKEEEGSESPNQSFEVPGISFR